MITMTPEFLSKIILLVLLSAPGARAQADMAECKHGWEWNRNSLDQDPCLIGSLLDASCRGLTNYHYPPLNSSQYYLPPSKDHSGDLQCDCNTVMYSLYMACASCQSGEVNSWTSWKAACEAVYVGLLQSDIPQGTAVPYWAYADVTTFPDQLYNDPDAIHLGRYPEGKPEPTNTTDGESSTPPVETTTAAPAGLHHLNDSEEKIKLGAIVGGVVGSVVPLAILATIVFLYARNRQQKAPKKRELWETGSPSPYQQQPHIVYSPTLHTVPFPPQYNPGYPLPFPPQSLPGVKYATQSRSARDTYTGVAEA